MRQANHQIIFLPFRKNQSAAQTVHIPSMKISGNQMEPSLVSKPHEQVFPNYMKLPLPGSVMFGVTVHCHQGKTLSVA